MVYHKSTTNEFYPHYVESMLQSKYLFPKFDQFVHMESQEISAVLPILYCSFDLSLTTGTQILILLKTVICNSCLGHLNKVV